MIVKKSLICLLVCIFSFSPYSLLAKELIPGGETIGIKMDYEGIAIISTYSFQANNQQYHPSKHLESGDIIVECNHQKVTTIQELNNVLTNQTNEEVPITIIRNHQKLNSILYYVYDKSTNAYVSGLYLQDNISGIGTITYYDPDTQEYGALGHQILNHKGKVCDTLNKGTIYPSQVISIVKSKKGIPGEKHASIQYDAQIGIIHKNDTLGIFGTYDDKVQRETIETGTPTTGNAQIYTVLNGDKIEVFDIYINEVHPNQEKQLSIQITDQELIDKCGGIIQGMSGSPIIQDGKLVGAVTHVLVNDPTRGYGIFIENMLEASE